MIRFDEFDKPTDDAWWEVVKKSVKNPDELHRMIHEKAGGLKLNSLYRKHSLHTIQPLSVPLTFEKPKVVQPVYIHKVVAANQAALQALENGADTVLFIGPDLPTANEWAALMKGIHLDWFEPEFDLGESNTALFFHLLNEYQQLDVPFTGRRGAIAFDPITHAWLTGNFEYSRDENFKVLATMLDVAREQMPGYRLLHVNSYMLRDAGATAIQELACTLSHLTEYLDYFTNLGWNAGEIFEKMQVNAGTGEDYFTEIAKFRTLRYLLEKLAEAYQVPNSKVHVNAVTTRRNKTVYDIHNNVLRASSEAMAAIIGGCSGICVWPYNETYQLPDEQAYRLSRNIPLILMHEAHLDVVADPSAGSYYLEVLSRKMADAAWNLFLEMEGKGGYIKVLEEGWIQEKIQHEAAKAEEAFRQGTQVLVGTNKYVNKQEVKLGNAARPADNLFMKENRIMPVMQVKRLSEKLDEERMRLERQKEEKLN